MAILLTLCSVLLYSLLTRIPLELDVIRDRNRLFRETNEGLIENVYTLKIINMDAVGHTYRLTASGIPGLQLLVDETQIRVAPGSVKELPVRLRADEADLSERSSEVVFELQDLEDEALEVSEEARFLGPRQ
jgi:polyferredoxin